MEVHSPFADFIGVTVPEREWAGLLDEVGPEFEGLGMALVAEGDRSLLWRSAESSGTVKAQRYRDVWSLGISGSVCTGLRVSKRLMPLLAAVGSRPHRVTRLDAACDVKTDAAPIVEAIASAGRAGALALTRKRIASQAIETHLAPRGDGVLTGTVYCGTRTAEARMVVYDKRQERLARKLSDVGPLTRYELRLKSGIGMTLRDVAEPAAVFWHHVAPDFLPAPDGVPEWVPGAEGFAIERSEPPTPYARMLAMVDASPDVRRLLKLADQVGPYGLRGLLTRIEALAERLQRSDS